MKQLFIFILFLFIIHPIIGQNAKGVIRDESGETVPGVSIFVRETKQGAIANADGAFQLRLNPGIYHLEFRSLGYETEEIQIELQGNEELNLAVQLKFKITQLQEIQVFQGEDPAYRIMRKAIEKAPYYNSIIKEAVYETYTKGSGKFLGVPKAMKAIADKEDKEMLDMYTDRLFLQESLSEISYKTPDEYKQTVKAFSSSMPFMDDPKSALRIGLISLYKPMWGNVISPLNPKAFSYYKFRYEGFIEENGQNINIIRIMPKLKDPKMIEGVIHIADDEWNIRHINYLVHNMGMEILYSMNFNPVIDGIYLVTNYESKIKANLLGMRFDMNLLSSIQYLDIQVNDSIQTSEKKSEQKKKKKLELISRQTETQIDSLAQERDSLYWDEIRSIVLSDEELLSYQEKDSLKIKQDSISNAFYNPTFSAMDILMGGTLGNDSSLVYFHYNGLLSGALKEYNFVDGLWMGQSFELDFKKRKNKGFIFYSDFYWTTARKQLAWQTDLDFSYAPKSLGKAQLSIGHLTEDFSGSEGTDRFLNSIFSLDGGRNYAKFFDSEFIRFKNGIDLANGLHLSIGAELNRNTYLENHTTWNLFGVKNKSTPNTPDYEGDLNLQFTKRVNYSIGLQYTPEYYYRIQDGKKQYVRTRFPTFELYYQQGLPESIIENNSVYQRLEFSVQQRIRLNYFSRLHYKVVAGKFFNKNEFNYVDYKHFATGGPWLSFRSWDTSFALLPYYEFSTNREWIQAFVNYNTDYLLLKRLPFLQGKMITETLQAKFLHTPDKPCYTEWAYSVDLPMGLGGAGIFVAFDKFDYNGIGFQVSLPILQATKNKRNMSIEISF